MAEDGDISVVEHTLRSMRDRFQFDTGLNSSEWDYNSAYIYQVPDGVLFILNIRHTNTLTTYTMNHLVAFRNCAYHYRPYMHIIAYNSNGSTFVVPYRYDIADVTGFTATGLMENGMG
jgi:hypothetical protein